MEKSRAIELLKLAVPIKALTQQEYADFVEAVNMGMDALEQPTSPDTISRQATIDAVNNAFDRETLLTGFVRSIAVRAIRDMPSAQPEPHWIPVSERLPEESGYYITSNEYGGVIEDFYCDDYFWIADRNAYSVIAWMPKPKAYNPNK